MKLLFPSFACGGRRFEAVTPQWLEPCRWRQRAGRGFTLIEIMVVLGVIAIILSLGVPPLYRALQREGMRKAVNEIVEVCNSARRDAIMNGTMVELVIDPMEGRFQVSGGGGRQADTVAGQVAGAGAMRAATVLPEDVRIDLLFVNWAEYTEAEEVRIRFFPNGTSDEMRLVLSDAQEQQAIDLEVTTGVARIERDVQKWLR